MEWKAEYTKDALNDLKNLDRTQQMQVIKAKDLFRPDKT